MADATTRPQIPVTHADPEEHRRLIAARVNNALMRDGSNGMGQPLPLVAIAVADLPDAALWEGALVYVSDEVGGAVPAFSDGTSWRRVTDRMVAA